MNQPIFEKITKLLRLAERATGAEAELALEKAQKLATEHQVDLATIDTSEGERERKEEFVQDEVEYSEKSLSVYIQWLLNKHFHVQTCYNRRAVFFVGRKSDVVFAQYLFGWLQNRFMAEWREEKRKPSHGAGRRSAKAFFYGMYQGLDEKLRQARKDAEESRIVAVGEARAETPMVFGEIARQESVKQVRSQYQLAVVQEKDELQKEYERQFPHVRGRSSMSYSHGAGIAAGRAAGARTRIPGLPLNHSTRSALK
jgi:hypothetical protein